MVKKHSPVVEEILQEALPHLRPSSLPRHPQRRKSPQKPKSRQRSATRGRGLKTFRLIQRYNDQKKELQQKLSHLHWRSVPLTGQEYEGLFAADLKKLRVLEKKIGARAPDLCRCAQCGGYIWPELHRGTRIVLLPASVQWMRRKVYCSRQCRAAAKKSRQRTSHIDIKPA